MQETWVRFLGWEGSLEKGTATPVFWPGEFHGQRSLAAYSPWGCKESDTTDRLYHFCERVDKSTKRGVTLKPKRKRTQNRSGLINIILQTSELIITVMTQMHVRRVQTLYMCVCVCVCGNSVKAFPYSPWQFTVKSE